MDGERNGHGSVIRQAGMIVLAAAVLGFGYTAFMSKGLFRSPDPGRPEPARISYTEARALFDAGSAIFVDARPPFDFGLGHIKGAVNLPLKDFSTSGPLLDLLPRDRLLVTYCDGEDCNSSVLLAAKLDSAGFKQVQVFFGGWKEWSARHLPVE